MPDRTLTGRLGQYKLMDTLGSGTMATVYIGRDLEYNRIYAIKVLKPEIAIQDDLLQRFHREAAILGSLTTPHIVRLVEYALDNGTYFLVMEYVDGTTLMKRMMAERLFSSECAIHFAIQIAKGLHVAAQHEIYHRDVKPQNILVTPGDLIKLVDFGLARARTSIPITVRETYFGTPYYSSPEQIDSAHEADTRADLYSLACVFFHMLAGCVPYEGTNMVQVMTMHKEKPIPSLTTLRPDLPPAYNAVIQRGMAKKPEERFQTPMEFIQALEALKAVPLLWAQLLVLPQGPAIPLLKSHNTIGRRHPQYSDPEVDLTSLDTLVRVSKRHARIAERGGRFFIEDLESLNKTWLNGSPLTPYTEQELHPGDVLHIGDLNLQFALLQR